MAGVSTCGILTGMYSLPSCVALFLTLLIGLQPFDAAAMDGISEPDVNADVSSSSSFSPAPLSHSSLGSEANRVDFGVGFGYVGLAYINGRIWLDEKARTSFDLSLAPYLFVNVGTVAITRHIPVRATSDSGFTVSATAAGFATLVTSVAYGVGGRVGYEWMNDKVGYTLEAGLLQQVNDVWLWSPQLYPDVRVTLWFL
jgi:hypothetical protein